MTTNAKTNMRADRGFTLIELITAIVIASILAVVAGMGLVQIASGYLFAKKTAVAAEQTQIALTRLSKELNGLAAVSSATATSITYRRTGAAEQPHTLAWTSAGGPLTLDGRPLIDRVQSFSLTYLESYDDANRTRSYSPATAVLELILELRGYNDIPLTFVQRVTL